MTTSEQLRQRAAKAQERADRANDKAFGINERFEFGQPIIKNHHSTKGAQRDRAAADRATRQAIAEQEMADMLGMKADRSGRIERLRAELEAADIGPDDCEVGGTVTWADLNTGTRYASHIVRINKKSVSVEAGYTVPYDRIFKTRGRILP